MLRVAHFDYEQNVNRYSFFFHYCTEFHDLLYPTPNAPMSGAEVRSTEASAPLAGWAAVADVLDSSSFNRCPERK